MEASALFYFSLQNMQLRTEIKSQNNQNTSRLLTHSCLVTIWETFIFPDSEKFPLFVLGIPSAFHHFLVEAFEFFRNLRGKKLRKAMHTEQRSYLIVTVRSHSKF